MEPNVSEGSHPCKKHKPENKEEKEAKAIPPRHPVADYLSLAIRASRLGKEGWTAWCDLVHEAMTTIDRSDWHLPDGAASDSICADPQFRLWLEPSEDELRASVVGDLEYIHSTLKFEPQLAVIKGGDDYELLVLPASCHLVLAQRETGKPVEVWCAEVSSQEEEERKADDAHSPWLVLAELQPGTAQNYVDRLTVPEVLQKGVRTLNGVWMWHV